jgi:hypothetical protein
MFVGSVLRIDSVNCRYWQQCCDKRTNGRMVGNSRPWTPLLVRAATQGMYCTWLILRAVLEVIQGAAQSTAKSYTQRTWTLQIAGMKARITR